MQEVEKPKTQENKTEKKEQETFVEKPEIFEKERNIKPLSWSIFILEGASVLLLVFLLIYGLGNKKIKAIIKKRFLFKFVVVVLILIIIISILFGLQIGILFSLTGRIVDELKTAGMPGSATFAMLIIIVVLIVLVSFLIYKTKKKPTAKNRVSNLFKKKVYTESGELVGIIKDILIGENKIDSFKIKLTRKNKNKFKIKAISVKYSSVKNIGEIILIDERIFEKLARKS